MGFFVTIKSVKSVVSNILVEAKGRALLHLASGPHSPYHGATFLCECSGISLNRSDGYEAGCHRKSDSVFDYFLLYWPTKNGYHRTL